MARRNVTEISGKDIEEYIAGESDFAFEMSARRRLGEADFDCSHGGSYRDPVTDKIRNYDFRARRALDEERHIFLAVECKNIRSSSPLLVHATHRKADEAFHCLLRRHKVGGFDFATEHRRGGELSAYPLNAAVGRSTDQVARNADGEFKSSGDSATYEKLLQALHSTEELVREAATVSYSGQRFYAVVPVLVIPDGRLWQVDYAIDGVPAEGPRQVSRTTLLYCHNWTVPAAIGSVAYEVSHLEITTLSALVPRLHELTGRDGLFRAIDGLRQAP